MTERNRNIAVGTTAIIGLAGLAMMMVLFGYAPSWARRGYQLRIEMPQTGGLNTGDRVYYKGIDIGLVTEIGFQDHTDDGVYALALIEKAHPLPADAVAVIQPGGLLGGGAGLQIETDPTAPNAPTLPTDGSAIIPGRAVSMLQGAMGDFKQLLDQPLGQLKRVADQLEQLSDQWAQVGRNLNDLTQARTPQDVDQNGRPANLATVLARMDQRLGELKEVLANAQLAFEGANQWLHDPKLRRDVSATAANARKLTADLNQHANQLGEQYAKVADDLSAAMEEMRRTVELARTGDGTVGKLLNDPALYDHLDDAAERLNRLLDQANHLLEKLKKEGLPVQLGE